MKSASNMTREIDRLNLADLLALQDETIETEYAIVAAIAKKMPPCPDWCTSGAGHTYESRCADGALVRNHETAPFGEDPYSCVISTEETLTAGVLQPGELYIYLDVEAERLGADQARALADALLRAADALDGHATLTRADEIGGRS